MGDNFLLHNANIVRSCTGDGCSHRLVMALDVSVRLPLSNKTLVNRSRRVGTRGSNGVTLYQHVSLGKICVLTLGRSE